MQALGNTRCICAYSNGAFSPHKVFRAIAFLNNSIVDIGETALLLQLVCRVYDVAPVNRAT